MRECFSLSVLWKRTASLQVLKDALFKSTNALHGRVCSLVSHAELLWSAPVLGVALKTEPQKRNLCVKSHAHHGCHGADTHPVTQFSLAFVRGR